MVLCHFSPNSTPPVRISSTPSAPSSRRWPTIHPTSLRSQRGHTRPTRVCPFKWHFRKWFLSLQVLSSTAASSAIAALSPGGVLMQAATQQTINRECVTHTLKNASRVYSVLTLLIPIFVHPRDGPHWHPRRAEASLYSCWRAAETLLVMFPREHAIFGGEGGGFSSHSSRCCIQDV